MSANDLVNEVREEFLQKNANLLALTKSGANDVMRRIASSMALDKSAREDVLFHMDTIDQKGIAGRMGRDSFKAEMYRQICRAFLRVQRNYRIDFVTKLTLEAIQELEAIEVAADERESAPVAPPPPSEQELLEAEVIADYNGALSTDKMRAKMQRNPAYRAVAERLLAGDSLRTKATTLIDGSRGLQ